MRHIAVAVWLTLTAFAAAQQPIEVSREHPFIRYEANHLHYDTASPTLRHFFHKWRHVSDAMQGNVNIVHIGSSHVQGGTFPNRLRYNLMSDLPDLVGDRGLIFPYSAAAKCNNPPDYVVHCPEKVELTRCVHASPSTALGLCGIAVTARDVETHIQIALRPEHIDYATRQVVVIGESGQQVVPLLSIEERMVPPSYIDAATRRHVFNLSETVDSFEIVLPCAKGEAFTLMGVYLGNRQPGFSYHSIGVNGATLSDYMKCDYFAADLRLLHPDMVIFGIGINDASGTAFDTAVFYARYMQLVNLFRASNPDCAFLFITNNDSFRGSGRGRRRRYKVNENGTLAREVFYRLARDTQGAVWDQFEVMGGLKSMDQWCKAGLAQRDHVHFTQAGYTLLGDLLYNALVEACRSMNVAPRKSQSEKPQNNANIDALNSYISY